MAIKEKWNETLGNASKNAKNVLQQLNAMAYFDVIGAVFPRGFLS